ncbi:MAG TPA: UDP-3-O-(3-hydroxymyristoyl)glucosamine N-acyltransferase [Terriglobales bacterium]|nr:UDP-3-O-(3-hydroxymyristoyl)glucosamine N-acyltransferase [Terriglobales bacterium]
MACSVKHVADWIGARLLGDGSVELRGISSIAQASPGDLVFVEEGKHLEKAIRSRAAAVIAGEVELKKASLKPVLMCEQPRLAFARAAQLLRAKPERKAAIHPSAWVDPSAECGAGVTIEERVVIREGVKIGAKSWIGAGGVIGAHAILGQDCELYPQVTVYPGVRLGNRVIVHSGAVLGSDGFGYVRDRASGHYEKFPQVGRLEIDDDVEIGANSTIDRGALEVTRIGRGTKIDNLVHVGHNVQIGEDVVIAAQTGVSGSAVIENQVLVGGQVGIADHVRIEAGAILGAQSGIPSKKVIRGRGVTFWGTPARPIREYLKELALLARLAKKR